MTIILVLNLKISLHPNSLFDKLIKNLFKYDFTKETYSIILYGYFFSEMGKLIWIYTSRVFDNLKLHMMLFGISFITIGIGSNLRFSSFPEFQFRFNFLLKYDGITILLNASDTWFVDFIYRFSIRLRVQWVPGKPRFGEF